MAQRGNPVVRAALTTFIVLVVIGVAWSFFQATKNKPTPTSPPAAPPSGALGAAPGSSPERPATGPSDPGEQTPATPAGSEAPQAVPSVSLEGLNATVFGPWTPDSLGALAPDSSVRQLLEIDPVGAGVRALSLGRYFGSVKRETNVRVQETHNYTDSTGARAALVPFAALGVQINGTLVNLYGANLWRPVESAPAGTIEAIITNNAGQAVARVERSYALTPDSYEILLYQRVQNLTDADLRIRWFQFGPVDLPNDTDAGTSKPQSARDMRRVRFGYLLKPTADPTRRAVFATDFLWPRTKALGKTNRATGLYQDAMPIWPNPTSEDAGLTLTWAAMTNRYFGVAAHALVQPASPSASFTWVERVERVVLHTSIPAGSGTVYAPVMGMKFQSSEIAVAPGSGADLAMGIYAGPLERDLIDADPVASAAGVPEIVVYNSGGPCAFCTFPVLTSGLLWLLETTHGLTADWAIAIIILVVIVRTALHPINRWSQIRMQRFAKQMQDMAPKQKKLQERYGDDRQKLQQEVAKLWREEGVNPAGMLGCLPMFLQTPIWIALYATLYYAFELRQQPAFYGLFQSISGGSWAFLADLAEPDHALWFQGKGFHIPLISGMMGPITGLNILPLVWGAVFWVHQKYLTPPSTGTLTPEQEQQQKIIKVMSVVMLPVFMYNAPSGLLVYFLTNSVLAIIENHWIREHVKKHDLLNPDKYKKQKKPAGGFMQRLQKLAEDRQRQASAAKGGRNPNPRGPQQRPPRR